ncbi:MAG: hypothetical protein ACE5HS_17435 [bacterium]
MIFKRQRSWIYSVLCITSLFIIERAAAQKSPDWRVKNRLQLGYEFDSNIRESASDSARKIADTSLRFLFHSRASRVSPRTRIEINYKGGLQTYFGKAIENKLINELDFTSGIKIQNWVAGLRGAGRLKVYLNDQLDYSTGSVEAYLRPPAIYHFQNEISFKLSGLSYQNFPSFNFRENQLSGSISRKLTSRLTGRVQMSIKSVFYDRIVLISTVEQPEDFFEIKLQDDAYQLTFGLNYSKSFLININYTFQHNNSNSKVFDYNKHLFVLIFGMPLPKGVWLRGYGAAQIKDYFEQTLPIHLRDIDTERDESNFFILDLSKDVNSSLNALLRFAYYNNESIIRSRFYSKSLLTLGFDYRF